MVYYKQDVGTKYMKVMTYICDWKIPFKTMFSLHQKNYLKIVSNNSLATTCLVSKYQKIQSNLVSYKQLFFIYLNSLKTNICLCVR